MKVKIVTKDFRMSMPVPVSMAGWVVRMLPERVFEEARRGIGPPYGLLVTKEYVSMLVGECLDVLRENKGLEVVHVEATDGTFVSVRL